MMSDIGEAAAAEVQPRLSSQELYVIFILIQQTNYLLNYLPTSAYFCNIYY